MLANVFDYEKEIEDKFRAIWYDPAYHYYFGDDTRWTPGLHRSENENAHRHCFASVDKDGKLIGYISYMLFSNTRLVSNFGAMNFGGSKAVFAKDLMETVYNIFVKFGAKTFEFAVVRGNPAEDGYDKMIKRMNGRILCVRHNRALTMDGQPLDDKVYEVLREEFFQSQAYKYYSKSH